MDIEYSTEVCSRYLRSSAVKQGFAIPFGHNGMVGCNALVTVVANVWFYNVSIVITDYSPQLRAQRMPYHDLLDKVTRSRLRRVQVFVVSSKEYKEVPTSSSFLRQAPFLDFEP